jgi:ribosomal peptide maturation radical SAM protein 1
VRRTSEIVAPSVALVSMPFVDDRSPSIQLGILAEIARQRGSNVRTLHANLELAATMDLQIYRSLSQHRGLLVGDWLFSFEAFGNAAPDPIGRCVHEMASAIQGGGDVDGTAARLLELRERTIPVFLDRLTDCSELRDSEVIGFSCTFQQTVASIALARRLKARNPGVVIVFGGTSVEGTMGAELARAVPAIDVVVGGDGESSLPAVLDHVAEGAELPKLIFGRTIADLDESPVPDYAEYFERAERLRLLDSTSRLSVRLPFETARGCWWGAKHHCTFCGLNGETMQFRKKSSARVRRELAEQARRYGTFQFDSVDNILDNRFFEELIPPLAEEADYDLFWEVKANLRRAQMRALHRAGVRRIQPGIESLSSRLLALMRKGVRAAQNVNVLRWARYYGMYVDWNLLCGFPGEESRDYDDQVLTVPSLTHLQPPTSAGRVWLERFSPLFREQTSPFERRPIDSYRSVYPADVDLDQLAYFFKRETGDTLGDAAYEPLLLAVGEWQRAWSATNRPMLTFRRAPGLIRIFEGRPAFTCGVYTFTNELAELYVHSSDRPITAAALVHRLAGRMSLGEVDYALREFADRHLMFHDEPFWLTLALPATTNR